MESIKNRSEAIVKEINKIYKGEKTLATFLLLLYNFKVKRYFQLVINPEAEAVIKKGTRKYYSPLLVKRILHEMGKNITYRNAWYYAKALELVDSIEDTSRYLYNILTRLNRNA
ncbi:hypothetical protein CW711_01310 [Candidatus Bathyarchaeota archaeon]|nr:MAG: hypothetical protein CW711_01310 [Candidatus Bathyarchaeota archaeon]